MFEWLTKLGVGNGIRSLFGISGEAVFDYGDGQEIFKDGFLSVPVTRNIWRCGNEMAPHVIITWSAAEAMAMLTCRRNHLASLEQIQILSLGCKLSPGQCARINEKLKGRKFMLVFPDDPSGRAADITVAAGIRNIPVKLKWERSQVNIQCRNKEFCLPAEELSLAAFERAAGLRSHIRTIKPNDCNTFLEQLYEQR